MIDYLILLLLITTIFYAWRLHKKISYLKDTKEDLSILMQGFDEAIMRAEMSINELKQMSLETSSEFQKKIDKATYLTNDLSFMTDRATELADKLEKSISLSKIPLKPKTSNFQYKKVMSKDNDSNMYGNSRFENVRPEQISSNSMAEQVVQAKGTNIDSLLKKISEIRNVSNYDQNISSEPENIYKPTILRQHDYYKTLKKV